MQWSRGSKQSLWKRVFTSQHGGAHGWCRKDEQVEQQVHCGSVQTSRYSEEPQPFLFSPYGSSFVLFSYLKSVSISWPTSYGILCNCSWWREQAKASRRAIKKMQQQSTLKILRKELEANWARRLTAGALSLKGWQPIISPSLEAQVSSLFSYSKAPSS